MEISEIKKLIGFVNQNGCEIRLKYKDSAKVTEWHPWINVIESDYIDIGLVPEKKDKIEYLEINCNKTTSLGRMVKSKVTNYYSTYMLFLDSNNISYEKTVDNTIVIPF
jgi:hypothetical protein